MNGELLILARHAQTPANAALLAGRADNRVQGLSKDMLLSHEGEVQSYALGYALGAFITRQNVNVARVYSSDTVRAVRTRDNLLAAGTIECPSVRTDVRLRELSKGSLEGMIRSEAYPTKKVEQQQHVDWHFRHGTKMSGGETAFEAGNRWLEWFDELEPQKQSATLVVGHGLITAFGLTLLMERSFDSELPDLSASDVFRQANATALVMQKDQDGVISLGSIVPSPEEMARARQYINQSSFGGLTSTA